MFRDRYRPHDAFIAPARATAELWRLAAGIVLAGVAMVAVAQMLHAVLLLAVPDSARAGFNEAIASGNTPGGLVILLGSVVAVAVGAAFAARLLHQRGLASLTGPPRMAARQFWQVLKGLVVLSAVIVVLPPWDWTEAVVPLRPVSHWLVALPLGLAAILLQTASEEIAFRGYLQQQLAARFASPLVWLCGPSVLFALAHYDPATYGAHAWMIVLWTFLFGLAAADLVARSGTIGPAVALHFANNAYAVLLVATGDTLTGLALYALPVATDDPAFTGLMMLDLAVLGLSWLTARVMLRA